MQQNKPRAASPAEKAAALAKAGTRLSLSITDKGVVSVDAGVALGTAEVQKQLEAVRKIRTAAVSG